MDIPSTSVIKHWVAWGVTADCPDDYMEHSVERLHQFEAWLAGVKADAWEKGYVQGDYDAHSKDRLDRDNPYVIEVSNNDYDQLRKELDAE